MKILIPLAISALFLAAPLASAEREVTVTYLEDPALVETLALLTAAPRETPTGTPYSERQVALVGETAYLQLRGWDQDGGCHLWATVLYSPATPFTASAVPISAGTKHKCAGDPCSSCRFKYNLIGNIIGCRCSGGGTNSKCNHTITKEE